MSDWIELFDGKSLEGWAAKGEHLWLIAGDVALREDDPKLFAIEPGTGIMVNGETGRTRDIHTLMEHGSCELHVEFNVAKGSNSGVYLMGQYEIQVLDSWGTPEDKLAYHSNGGIYGRWIEETQTSYDGVAPLTNPSREPGEWQAFDIIFHAPVVAADGTVTRKTRFESIKLNGVTIHENVELNGPTRGAWSEAEIVRGPLRLQGDHGPVAYRNVRMRMLE
jgi:hypothetical protein